MAHRIERLTKEYRKAVSEEIRVRRLAAGLSMNRLAEDAHLSTAMISLIEADKRGPTVEALFRIALALKTTPADILTSVSENMTSAETKPPKPSAKKEPRGSV